MNKKKSKALTQEEQSDVKGGIPYEKPGLITLKKNALEGSCVNGDRNKGGSCVNGAENSDND